MKNKLLTILFLTITLIASAQNDKKEDKQTKGEKIKEAIKNLPEDLLAQPEAVADTNANKLINDNLSFEVPPLWNEKGATTIIEYKLDKCDAAPLNETFPLPDKKIVQMVTMNMGTVKKTPADKKASVLTEIQKHLTAYYKEAGKTISKEELAVQVNNAVISHEEFITSQGRTGEIYFLHDIQTQQAGFVSLLLLPSADGTKTTFVQLNYWHYVYETTLPEDPLELRVFVYAEDQQTYMDFNKKMLKTLVIK